MTHITDEEKNIQTVSLYLIDIAMLWWRRKEDDIKRGTCVVATWANFRKRSRSNFTLRIWSMTPVHVFKDLHTRGMCMSM